MTATPSEEMPVPPPRKRRDDPEAYDPLEERGLHNVSKTEVMAMVRNELQNGGNSQVAVDTKFGKVSIMGRDALSMLVVFLLGVGIVGIVYHVKESQKDIALGIANESRARRVSDEWNRHGHALLHYDGLRKDCILLLSAQQKEAVNQELNRERTIAPLQWRCQWLGEAPAAPTIAP